jgi:hypothetical protein
MYYNKFVIMHAYFIQKKIVNDFAKFSNKKKNCSLGGF